MGTAAVAGCAGGGLGWGIGKAFGKAAGIARKAGMAKKPALPDSAWSKNAPRQVQPGTRTVDHSKYNAKTGEVERSRAHYDPYGRQTSRTDYTPHGRPQSLRIHTTTLLIMTKGMDRTGLKADRFLVHSLEIDHELD